MGALCPHPKQMVIDVVDLDAAAMVSEAPAAVRYEERVYVDDAVEARSVPRKRGRPRKIRGQEQLSEVVRLYFVEKLSMRKVAEVMGMSHMSVYRMLSDPNVEVLL